MNILSLINALPGAAAQGLIWGIMAIGVYLTFRILDVADLTVDGTMCTGGAVCVMMLMSGHNIWVSMLAATGAGMLEYHSDRCCFCRRTDCNSLLVLRNRTRMFTPFYRM